MREAKCQEFLKLEQGNMTVEEYDQEFDALSQFASELVRTEVERADKFVRDPGFRLRPYTNYPS